jgi:hypothetical protein
MADGWWPFRAILDILALAALVTQRGPQHALDALAMAEQVDVCNTRAELTRSACLPSPIAFEASQTCRLGRGSFPHIAAVSDLGESKPPRRSERGDLGETQSTAVSTGFNQTLNQIFQLDGQEPMTGSKALATERDFPHIVELAMPVNGLDVRMSRDIAAFHRSRNIQQRFGRAPQPRGKAPCVGRINY